MLLDPKTVLKTKDKEKLWIWPIRRHLLLVVPRA